MRSLGYLMLLGWALLPSGCGSDVSAVPDGETTLADAGSTIPDGAAGAVKGQFELTYYWVAAEADYLDAGAANTPVYDKNCNVLATVPASFANSLRIEATGELADGRVLNYEGSCHCPTASDTTTCYAFVDAQHPWGSGAGGRALVPFRSIAIDPSAASGLVLGQHYWVKEFAGVQVPGDPPVGGFVHDGCVSADDTGGDILGMHIDWFVALKAYYFPLDRIFTTGQVTIYDGGTKCP